MAKYTIVIEKIYGKYCLVKKNIIFNESYLLDFFDSYQQAKKALKKMEGENEL